VRFTIEATVIGDKSNCLTSSTDDNNTNPSAGETSCSEGKNAMGCQSETPDSNNVAEKKVASELHQELSGTEGTVTDASVIWVICLVFLSGLSTKTIHSVYHSCCLLAVPSFTATLSLTFQS